jgi:signal peptidase I
MPSSSRSSSAPFCFSRSTSLRLDDPTLLVGDYLFVSKYSYGYTHYSLPFSPPIFTGRVFGQPVDRGDVVVFRLPKDDTTDYIKRVIGLPGDRIQMIDGVLNINGEPVKRERIEDFVTDDDGVRAARQALSRDAAERRQLHHARSHR